MIIKFLLAMVLCELIVELVIKSEIFEPVVNIFKSRIDNNKFFWFFGSLFSCGYCFSVWVGIFIAVSMNITLFKSFILGYGTIGYILDLILSGLIIHRGSNVLHNVIDKWTNKFYDLRFRKTDDIIINEEIKNGD